MKQLKFMLAAAAAFGIATAQANTQLVKTEISSENFDGVTTLNDTAAVLALDGFSYEGATASDNESVVVAGGANESDNALMVNTGTDPLLRKIYPAGAATGVPLDATKKVYIDTMVQFTVTPYGDTVSSNGVNDKLMIYLKEMTNGVGEVTGTNLMVKAAKYQKGDDWEGIPESFAETDVSVSAADLTVTTNTWYSLEVVASVDNGVPVFSISIDGKQLTSDVLLYGNDGTKFPSLLGKDSTSLVQVGFAGEGMVDSLVFSQDVEQQTSVDFTFTLTWDEAGFSSVTYTIDDGKPLTPENGGSFTVADGKKLAIAYTLNEWYKISGTPVLEYTAAVNGTGSLTLEAEKVITTESTVDGTVTVNPSATADELAAVKREAGITGGAFKDSDAEELGKALTWQKKNNVSGTDVSAVAFDSDGNPAVENGVTNVAAQAYLLNCPVDATTIKTVVAPQFKFTAISVVNGKPVYNVSGSWTDNSENVYNFNGKPAFQGATTLGQWHAVDADGKIPGKDEGTTVLPSFFKATLINK